MDLGNALLLFRYSKSKIQAQRMLVRGLRQGTRWVYFLVCSGGCVALILGSTSGLLTCSQSSPVGELCYCLISGDNEVP